MGEGLSDKLRIHISGKLAQNFDYTNAGNRNQDMKEFIKTHNSQNPKNQIDMDNVRTTHKRVLDSQLKNKGIDPKILGRKTKKKQFNPDMNAKITPKPQAGELEKKPQLDKTGKPIIQGAPVVVQPETFDEKAVSSSINGMWLVVKAALPDLELLSDAEKDSLGALFKPMFNRYLANDKALLVIPFIAAAGIFLPKLAKAKKLKSERQKAELPQDTPKTKIDTPPNEPINAPVTDYYSNVPSIIPVEKTNVPLEEEPKPKSKPVLPK